MSEYEGWGGGPVGHAPPKPAPKPFMYVKETDYSATVPDLSVEYIEGMEINKGRFAENREGSGLMSEWKSRQTTEDTILRL